MRVFIVYCHPSKDSFTKNMCAAFIKGITDSGNEYIMSDLYEMGFDPVMKEKEYLRDANYRDTPAVADDVRKEQEKINSADAIAFIYPVFWTEAPAMLVGWFDRVWSYGFAYGNTPFQRSCPCRNLRCLRSHDCGYAHGRNARLKHTDTRH